MKRIEQTDMIKGLQDFINGTKDTEYIEEVEQYMEILSKLNNDFYDFDMKNIVGHIKSDEVYARIGYKYNKDIMLELKVVNYEQTTIPRFIQGETYYDCNTFTLMYEESPILDIIPKERYSDINLENIMMVTELIED